MEKQEQEFITEVIKKMAEKGFSLLCPVCGGKKKTKDSKTCQKCSRPGIAQDVEQAVEKYQQTTKNQVEIDKINRLNSNDWENRQKEVRAIVEDAEEGGKKCRDEWIFEDLQDSHENYTDELCWSIVRTFRRRQRCRDLILRSFDVDGYSYNRETLIENILDLDNKFKNGEVSYIVDEVALAEMRKLAKGKITRRDLSGSVYSRACQISDKEGGIYGICFKKLIRAVGEEMKKIAEQMSQATKETKRGKATSTKLNMVWVMCKNNEVATEAIKVFLLTKRQMRNKELISELPPDSYVVQDVVHINNVPLFEVRNDTLIEVGPCRKATREDRNRSDEYLSELNRNRS